VAFFLAGVGAMLAAAVAVLAARSLLLWSKNQDPAGRDAMADRAHLLLLCIVVLGTVRFVAWPYFYFLLKSWVDDLAPNGVMCAYGVARLAPRLTLSLEVLKPLVLLGVGLWLLCERVDRRSKTAPLLLMRLAVAVPISLLALVECGVEIAFILSDKLGRQVTCCSQLLDIERAPTPSFSGSPGSPTLVLSAYAILNLVAIATALLVSRRAAGWLATVLVAVGGAANLAVTRWVWAFALAPVVLEMPYHHCVYELLTDTPALGFAAALAVAGNGGLLLPLGLQIARARALETTTRLQGAVYRVCAVALASELLIVLVHLL